LAFAEIFFFPRSSRTSRAISKYLSFFALPEKGQKTLTDETQAAPKERK
jgi:hypothetical protein